MDPTPSEVEEFLQRLYLEDTDDEKIVTSLQSLVGETYDVKAFLARKKSHTSTYDNADEFTQLLLKKVREYQTSWYGDRPHVSFWASASRATDDDDDGRTIHMHTSADHNDQANAASGCWAADWDVRVVDERTATLAVSVSIRAWSGESGNVQTHIAHTVPEHTISTLEEVVHSLVAKFENETMSYQEQLVTAIVKRMKEIQENEVYSAVASLNTEATIRSVRRVLPITRTRFKWDLIAQRNVKLLNERNTSGM